jgi:hypothetical protein
MTIQDIEAKVCFLSHCKFSVLSLPLKNPYSPWSGNDSPPFFPSLSPNLSKFLSCFPCFWAQNCKDDNLVSKSEFLHCERSSLSSHHFRDDDTVTKEKTFAQRSPATGQGPEHGLLILSLLFFPLNGNQIE